MYHHGNEYESNHDGWYNEHEGNPSEWFKNLNHHPNAVYEVHGGYNMPESNQHTANSRLPDLRDVVVHPYSPDRYPPFRRRSSTDDEDLRMTLDKQRDHGNRNHPHHPFPSPPRSVVPPRHIRRYYPHPMPQVSPPRFHSHQKNNQTFIRNDSSRKINRGFRNSDLDTARDKRHVSSSTSTDKRHVSPSNTTGKRHVSSSTSTGKLHVSPSTSTGKRHVSPSTSTGKRHVSPSTATAKHHVSPSTSTGKRHVSPSTATGKHHVSPSTATAKRHVSPSNKNTHNSSNEKYYTDSNKKRQNVKVPTLNGHHIEENQNEKIHSDSRNYKDNALSPKHEKEGLKEKSCPIKNSSTEVSSVVFNVNSKHNLSKSNTQEKNTTESNRSDKNKALEISKNERRESSPLPLIERELKVYLSLESREERRKFRADLKVTDYRKYERLMRHYRQKSGGKRKSEGCHNSVRISKSYPLRTEKPQLDNVLSSHQQDVSSKEANPEIKQNSEVQQAKSQKNSGEKSDIIEVSLGYDSGIVKKINTAQMASATVIIKKLQNYNSLSSETDGIIVISSDEFSSSNDDDDDDNDDDVSSKGEDDVTSKDDDEYLLKFFKQMKTPEKNAYGGSIRRSIENSDSLRQVPPLSHDENEKDKSSSEAPKSKGISHKDYENKRSVSSIITNKEKDKPETATKMTKTIQSIPPEKSKAIANTQKQVAAKDSVKLPIVSASKDIFRAKTVQVRNELLNPLSKTDQALIEKSESPKNQTQKQMCKTVTENTQNFNTSSAKESLVKVCTAVKTPLTSKTPSTTSKKPLTPICSNKQNVSQSGFQHKAASQVAVTIATYNCTSLTKDLTPTVSMVTTTTTASNMNKQLQITTSTTKVIHNLPKTVASTINKIKTTVTSSACNTKKLTPSHLDTTCQNSPKQVKIVASLKSDLPLSNIINPAPTTSVISLSNIATEDSSKDLGITQKQKSQSNDKVKSNNNENVVTKDTLTKSNSTGPKTSNATVTGPKTSNATVTGTKTSNSTVTGPKTSNATVTGTKTSNATVTGTKTSNATVTSSPKNVNVSTNVFKDNIQEAHSSLVVKSIPSVKNNSRISETKSNPQHSEKLVKAKRCEADKPIEFPCPTRDNIPTLKSVREINDDMKSTTEESVITSNAVSDIASSRHQSNSITQTVVSQDVTNESPSLVEENSTQTHHFTKTLLTKMLNNKPVAADETKKRTVKLVNNTMQIHISRNNNSAKVNTHVNSTVEYFTSEDITTLDGEKNTANEMIHSSDHFERGLLTLAPNEKKMNMSYHEEKEYHEKSMPSVISINQNEWNSEQTIPSTHQNPSEEIIALDTISLDTLNKEVTEKLSTNQKTWNSEEIISLGTLNKVIPEKLSTNQKQSNSEKTVSLDTLNKVIPEKLSTNQNTSICGGAHSLTTSQNKNIPLTTESASKHDQITFDTLQSILKNVQENADIEISELQHQEEQFTENKENTAAPQPLLTVNRGLQSIIKAQIAETTKQTPQFVENNVTQTVIDEVRRRSDGKRSRSHSSSRSSTPLEHRSSKHEHKSYRRSSSRKEKRKKRKHSPLCERSSPVRKRHSSSIHRRHSRSPSPIRTRSPSPAHKRGKHSKSRENMDRHNKPRGRKSSIDFSVSIKKKHVPQNQYVPPADDDVLNDVVKETRTKEPKNATPKVSSTEKEDDLQNLRLDVRYITNTVKVLISKKPHLRDEITSAYQEIVTELTTPIRR